MDGLQTILIFFLGLIFCSHYCISESVQEVTFRPGENITLYCDCKVSTGVFVIWFFRNCSLRDQSHYVLTAMNQLKPGTKFPRLKFFKNESSESYDLLVINATNSDVGFYYCGTEETKVEKDNEKNIFRKDIFTYGNISTNLILDTCGSCSDFKKTVDDCDDCWKLLFSLCPTIFLLSVVFSSLLIYLLCQKTGKGDQDNKNQSEQKRYTEETQDEDICYAALEVHQLSKRPKKKTVKVKYSANEDSHSPCM
ncbi:uncharacterized protein LOC102236419 isoform X1 [Xiphophorus maculatus]|uniref:uncharacterized protein LOC102236419 isoform X1 n=1 Tax=Xiphophorus maculatus TaxID=8083 RepID=UPI000C6D355C|nr:uncharacterized protein LOC102236419 isoform X1 [Xiphophorus maculatus]